MAKMKMFALDVEITRKVTLFVPARRPNGAKERLLTEEGWREAIAYHDDIELGDVRRAVVTRIREEGA